ncbi:seryl-tRNA synthetase [Trueperella bonasi]|uniref:Serine--tRNA ligase n=1 Tax=Trueperella bonasi TaxID=312286 RepID=A0ABT9NFW6_9ACTO|nr:serine--tRNA ligase [Trueperella bonasi]MDP9806284.1 seryl-tRNA synthetase [Trueperella bonasi]
MIDIRTIRENPDLIKASQRARGASEADVDAVVAADEARRAALQNFEDKRAEQKELSRSIGKASPEERPAILEQAKAMAVEVKDLEQKANSANEAFEAAMLAIPNLIVDGVPAGGEDDFEILKHVGDIPEFSFEPKDHLDIAEGLDAIDMERGAKVSGARFYYMKGIGARLELALLNMAMDQAERNGFTAMMTPTLVKPEVMGGTGFLGAHADEIYYLPADDLYLTGTSEVSLAGYRADEIIDLSAGPLRYAGWSTCYRREAGSHGRDTRGIIRVHQFNKIEMFSFTTADEAEAEHERFLAWEEEMLAKVELPYRVIDTAAGDLGDSAARKFDCEAWLPTQNRFIELTSTSNCTTFQARRLKIRERTEAGTNVVATINGTLATTRWLVAMLENHQQADGSLYIPEAMRPYLGGRELIEPVK